MRHTFTVAVLALLLAGVAAAGEERIETGGMVHLAARYMGRFDGEVYAVDLKTFEVKALGPAGRAGLCDAMTVKHYLREADYDAENDLLVVATPLAGGGRVPAYDCARNRWVSLKVGGPDPVAKGYVSLGFSYDTKRNLHWAVGQWNDVYALRLDAKTAEVGALGDQ